MRIRTVKPEYWSHPVMARLPDECRLVAIAVLSMADDEGFFWADPACIKNVVWPFTDSSVKAHGAITTLVRVGWIEVRNHPTHGQVGKVVNFSKHQLINRPSASKIKGYWITDDSVSAHGAITDASLPEQGTGSEGAGSRERGSEGEAGKPATPAKQPRRKLTPVRDNPPTIVEVCDYANARRAAGFGTLNPNEFFNRNEAAGWVHGRNGSKDVVDWRAHYRAWDKPAPVEESSGGYTQDQMDALAEIEAKIAAGVVH